MRNKIKLILGMFVFTIVSKAEVKDSLGIIINSNNLEFISNKSKVNNPKEEYYVLLRNDSIVKLSSQNDFIKIDSKNVSYEMGDLYKSLKERENKIYYNSRSFYFDIKFGSDNFFPIYSDSLQFKLIKKNEFEGDISYRLTNFFNVSLDKYNLINSDTISFYVKIPKVTTESAFFVTIMIGKQEINWRIRKTNLPIESKLSKGNDFNSILKNALYFEAFGLVLDAENEYLKLIMKYNDKISHDIYDSFTERVKSNVQELR